MAIVSIMARNGTLANKLGAASAANLRYDDSNNLLFVGPDSIASTDRFQVFGSSSALAGIRSYGFGTSSAWARIQLDHSRGTGLVPTTVVNGEILGAIDFRGHDGTSFGTSSGSIQTLADAAVSTGIVPGRISLQTQNTSGILVEGFRVRSNQQVTASIAGSAGTPAMTVGNATTDGLFRPSAGTLAWSTSSTERWRWSSGGLFGINRSPSFGGIELQADTLNAATFRLLGSETGNFRTSILTSNSAGTVAAPTAMASGDSLTNWRATGHDGTAYREGAGIQFAVDNTVSTGVVPGRIGFFTANKTSGTNTETLRLNSDQQVRIHQVGTAALPTLIWTSDTTTGFFRPAANVIAFSASTAEIWRTGASGVAIGSTTFTGQFNVGTAAAFSVSSTGNVITSGTLRLSALTSNGGVLYTNGTGVFAQATAGTSTQVLHGGTTPGFAAVSLTADVSGILPIANGGTNSATQNFVDLTTNQTAAGNKTFSGILASSSGRQVKVRSAGAGAATVAVTDEVLLKTAITGGGDTVTLPSAVTAGSGATYKVKDAAGTAGTDNITVATAAGNIDGAATFVINTNRGSITVVSDGTDYHVV